MGMYDIETRTCEPKNFFAGDFPTKTESGIAGEALAEYTPVTKNSEGKIVAVAAASGSGETAKAATTGDVIGITAAAAAADEPVVYYMTGEFFQEALNLPDGVTVEDIKGPLRKMSIFLRKLG
ncbi:hypothetical protein AALA36_02525 [Lachnospiraceae bacterium 66-29]